MAGQPGGSYGLCVGEGRKRELLRQIRRDCDFLVQEGVMDYSLLVGVGVPVGDEEEGEGGQQPNGGGAVAAAAAEEAEAEDAEAPPLPQKATKGLRQALAKLPPFKFLSSTGWLKWGERRKAREALLSPPPPPPFCPLPSIPCGVHSAIPGTRHGAPVVFYFGLIDFLQPWSARKVLERKWKGARGWDLGGISCAEPGAYAARLVDFLGEVIS